MAAKNKTMSEVLRSVIADSGMSHKALARETGVQRASIMRFMHGQQSLRLDKAEKLADYFGLELVKRKAK